MLECRVCHLPPEGCANSAPLEMAPPRCPVCNALCEAIYTIKGTGQPLGCECCITVREAGECA